MLHFALETADLGRAYQGQRFPLLLHRQRIVAIDRRVALQLFQRGYRDAEAGGHFVDELGVARREIADPQIPVLQAVQFHVKAAVPEEKFPAKHD